MFAYYNTMTLIFPRLMEVHNHRPALQHPHRIPLADGDIDGDIRPVWRKYNRISACAHNVVVEFLNQSAPQTSHRFRTFSMPMNGHRTTRLQRIQHPLRPILQPAPILLHLHG